MEVNHYNWKQLIGLLCLVIEHHVKNFKVHRRDTFNFCQPWNFLNFAATFDFSVSLLIAGLVRLDRFFSSQKSNEIEHFIPVSPTKTVCVHSKCVFRPTEPCERIKNYLLSANLETFECTRRFQDVQRSETKKVSNRRQNPIISLIILNS